MILEYLVTIQFIVICFLIYYSFNKLLAKGNIVTELEKENTRLNSENEFLKQSSIDKERELKLFFDNYVNQLITNKTEVLKSESTHNLNNILRPLQEKLSDFQQKVEQVYNEEARERFSLKNEIKNLLTNNATMLKETENLTNALKGSVKAQGVWGEIILEKILESSGLTKGVEYITQGTDLQLKSDDAKSQRPDVIINLPDDKHIIVDAKVSLKHYEKYIEASSNGDTVSVQENLALFIKSLQNHINNLSSKQYQHNEKLLTPDFVIMFFPIEGAFSLALQTVPDLLMQAWSRKIVIVSPTTLFATLKTIASIWLFEKQNKNALKIASDSGKLYDKLVAFTDDFAKVGQAINRADEAYQQAINKFSSGKGNILSRTESIKTLGIKAKKQFAKEWQDKLNDSDENNFLEQNDSKHDDSRSRDNTANNNSERELLRD